MLITIQNIIFLSLFKIRHATDSLPPQNKNTDAHMCLSVRSQRRSSLSLLYSNSKFQKNIHNNPWFTSSFPDQVRPPLYLYFTYSWTDFLIRIQFIAVNNKIATTQIKTTLNISNFICKHISHSWNGPQSYRLGFNQKYYSDAPRTLIIDPDLVFCAFI